jgi:hypothetical protein
VANADHLIGSLVITVAVCALAEVARPLRFLNALFGAMLLTTPLAYEAGTAAMLSSLIAGSALIVLSIPRGSIRHAYGSWNRWLA